jgi:hypothetical protein
MTMCHRRFCFPWSFVFFVAAIVLSGCDEDKRLVKLSEEAANRQAEQNKEIARQSLKTAEATKELVAADAKARQELTALQHELRTDQAEIGKNRDALELERQRIAADRRWDSLLAPAVANFGVFLVIAASLAFCGYLLMGLRHEKVEAPLVEELLIEELVSDHPRLLPTIPVSPPVLHVPSELEDASKDSQSSST